MFLSLKKFHNNFIIFEFVPR